MGSPITGAAARLEREPLPSCLLDNNSILARGWEKDKLTECRSLKQVLSHEQYRGVELEIRIALLAEAVAFIFGHEVPDRRALLLQRFHDLLRLAPGHARVI